MAPIGKDGGIAEYDVGWRGKGLLGADVNSWHVYVERGIGGQGLTWMEGLTEGEYLVSILA